MAVYFIEEQLHSFKIKIIHLHTATNDTSLMGCKHG
jgi:hypothetical protein